MNELIHENINKERLFVNIKKINEYAISKPISDEIIN